MNKSHLLSGGSLAAALLVFAGSAYGVAYNWAPVDSNFANPANWTGGLIPTTVGAGDTVSFDSAAPFNMDGGGSQSGNAINLNPGGVMNLTPGWAQHIITRVNVNGGTIVALTGDTNRIGILNVTANSTIDTTGRFDIREGENDMSINPGVTLTKINGNGFNFYNTRTYQGFVPGVSTSTHFPSYAGAGYGNFNVTAGFVSAEGGTRLNDINLQMRPGTTLTTWDGTNSHIDANILLEDATINHRYNDANKTYSGQITVPAGRTGFLNPEINGNPTPNQVMNIQGPVVGAGALMKNGPGDLHISGGANTYAGGTMINSSGNFFVEANNALGTGTVTNNDPGSVIRFSNSTANEFRETGVDVNLQTTPPAPANQLGNVATMVGLFSNQQVSGTTFATDPFGHDTRYTYTGSFDNTTGSTQNYTFREHYDDAVFLEVDGNIVLNDGNWNTPTSGSISLSPGAHSLRVAVRDSGGGAGFADPAAAPGFASALEYQIGAGAFQSLTPAGGFNVYQAQNRTIANNFVLNAVTTMSTQDMNGFTTTLTGDISGTNTLIKAGLGRLNLTGVTTATGAVMVNQGTLSLNGTHSFSSGTVASGATLEGNGSATGASMNVAAGGTVAPGNSVGTGTLSLGSVTIDGDYDAEASASGVNDLLVAATIWGAGAEFELALLGGYNPAVGDSFDFVNGAISGTAPTFTLPTLDPGELWDTSQFMSIGVLRVIPEPAAALLGVFGLGFLARRRRR